MHVKNALENACAGLEGVNVDPLVLCSEDAIHPAAIRGAVRAICAADIVIADVTGYDPSVPLLLGIRAAVRRSITIVCTKQARSAKLWKDLPFNLKELNLVSLHNEKSGHQELLASLRAGLTQSDVSARYLDLPVYDYVRDEPTDDRRADPQHVLWLRAFKAYGGDRAVHVENRIRKGLGLTSEARLETVIDQSQGKRI